MSTELACGPVDAWGADSFGHAAYSFFFSHALNAAGSPAGTPSTVVAPPLDDVVLPDDDADPEEEEEEEDAAPDDDELDAGGGDSESALPQAMTVVTNAKIQWCFIEGPPLLSSFRARLPAGDGSVFTSGFTSAAGSGFALTKR